MKPVLYLCRVPCPNHQLTPIRNVINRVCLSCLSPRLPKDQRQGAHWKMSRLISRRRVQQRHRNLPCPYFPNGPFDEGGKWDPDAAAYRMELTNE